MMEEAGGRTKRIQDIKMKLQKDVEQGKMLYMPVEPSTPRHVKTNPLKNRAEQLIRP